MAKRSSNPGYGTMARDISQFSINLESSIGEALACIDRSARISIALILDASGALVNTVSDGDIRRGILAGLQLSDPVSKLLPIKARTPRPIPVTAPAGTLDVDLLKLMQKESVRQVPLLDPDGRVVDIAILSDLLPQQIPVLRAMVMAGGRGSRLMPLTEAMPKPMLPVGGRPLMELIIEQLRDVGVNQVNVAINYQGEKIEHHFGDGSVFGVNINYVREESPLGTGGALGLLEDQTDPLLVINGDILTRVDYRDMFAFHRDHGAEMTVGVRRYEIQVPYGVVEIEGHSVKGLAEKPQLVFFVNAGIYLIEPSVLKLIPANQHLNMTDLIDRLLQAGQTVASFPICEYWLDVGQHADYARAQEDARNGQFESRSEASKFRTAKPKQ